jgi:formylglycine-generating enzyme required for sulfatase activity
MGCVPNDAECEDREQPRRHVEIAKPFLLGRTLVTVAAYKKYVNATGRSMSTAEVFNPEWKFDDHPIVNVTWNDAVAFCEWAGGRLPSEEEWEYAARGGKNGLKYPWGDLITHDNANYGQDLCCGGLAKGRDRWENTSPVGSFASNGYGLSDMAGNVWQWCADSAGNGRALRGGSWLTVPAWLRVSFRYSFAPGQSGNYIGFRCARERPELLEVHGHRSAHGTGAPLTSLHQVGEDIRVLGRQAPFGKAERVQCSPCFPRAAVSG